MWSPSTITARTYDREDIMEVTGGDEAMKHTAAGAALLNQVLRKDGCHAMDVFHTASANSPGTYVRQLRSRSSNPIQAFR